MKRITPSQRGETRFWRPTGLGGTELAYASYRRHSFPPHFHDEYVIAIMVRGMERLRHARHNQLAPSGSLILINPGQVHQNSTVNDTGFTYRTVYVPAAMVERCLVGTGICTQPLPEFVRSVA